MPPPLPRPSWFFVLLASVCGCATTTPASQCPPAAATSTATAISPAAPSIPEKPPIRYELPRAEDFTGEQIIFAVTIPADGPISVDNQTIDSDDTLRERVRTAVQSAPNVRGIIRADGLARWKNVIHVMDVLKQGGVTKIAFAVSAEAQSEERPALPDPSTLWNCAFPAEADKAKIDDAAVTIVVHVRADGIAERVDVLNDPGHGFGAAAATCAKQRKYTPPNDEQGRPKPGRTPPIRIRFTR